MKLGTLSALGSRRLLGWEPGSAGSRGLKTRSFQTFPDTAHRAPLISGMLVLAVLAAVTTVTAQPGRLRNTTRASGAPVTASASIEAPTVATSNVRAQPDARGAVVAVLPAGRQPQVLGRTADGAWLLVAANDGTQGWLPADRLDLPVAKRDQLEVVTATEAPVGRTDGPVALPDLALGAVYLLKDGRIALEIRNEGGGPLNDTRIPLLVTRASGETVGVLEVGPATLAARGVATVVTPIVVTATGTYTLELDRQESIVEAARTNNSVTRLFVVGGG